MLVKQVNHKINTNRYIFDKHRWFTTSENVNNEALKTLKEVNERPWRVAISLKYSRY